MRTDQTEGARRRATEAAGIAYDGDLQRGFIQGWDAALAYMTNTSAILLKTLELIGNGAGIAGDPATYPDYIMRMCRDAVAEYKGA